MTGASILAGFSVLSASVAAVLVGVSLLWIVSVVIRDASIVDIFWGPGFALAAWSALAAGAGPQPRTLLLAAMISVWGVRLGAYLARRNLGHGEDRRYVAIRARVGPRFPIVSLGLVFWLQGGLILLVSVGVPFAMRDASGGVGPADVAVLLLWACGLAFEAVGDAQLARFKGDPANAGRVMDRGLWRYTRHPNYFGDCVVWWATWLETLILGAPAWTVIGPVVMTVLLLRVSGVALLERTIVQRRPDYADYIRRTSPFLPLPPRA